MPRPASIHPTEFELEILKVLWESSPLPVREIRESMARTGRDNAHTTVITILNIMVEKKYLKKKKQGKSYLFWPVVSEEDVSSKMLGDIGSLHSFDRRWFDLFGETGSRAEAADVFGEACCVGNETDCGRSSRGNRKPWRPVASELVHRSECFD